MAKEISHNGKQQIKVLSHDHQISLSSRLSIIHKRCGYRSKRKVENFRNSEIFWPHAGTYCPNLSIKKPHNVVT
jgi:hypothetical protein